MPLLESRADRSRIRSNLLAVCRGAVLGLLTWRLAESALATSIPAFVAILAGLLAGFVIAHIADAVLSLRARLSNAGDAPRIANASLQRLAEEKACLEHLDAEREFRGDPSFGKTTEDRIVWNELLDLELQDIDEQVNRICQATTDAAGRRSRTSGSSHNPHSH